MRTPEEINADIKELIKQNPEVFAKYCGLAWEYLNTATNTALLLANSHKESVDLIRLTKH